MSETLIIKKLDSGFWHVRFSANQFIQWPISRSPTREDCFGWISERQLSKAAALSSAIGKHA
jgi:hypothetical protein